MTYFNQNVSRRIIGIIFSLFFLFILQATAAEEPQENVLRGNAIQNQATLTTADPVFGTPAWNFQVAYGVQNLVQFEIDFDNLANKYFHNLSFTVNCTIKIDCYRNPASPNSFTTYNDISLQIAYDPASGATYKGIANYKFDGSYKVVVTVNTIQATGISLIDYPIFKLTNKLIVNRQFNFIDAPGDVMSYTTDGKKMNISWVPTNYPGAESFDLEWTYLDELSAPGAAILAAIAANQHTINPALLDDYFRNNNSRITLAGNSYEFNLNYNQGFFLFRLRGVQYRQTDGLRLEGNWNYAAQALQGSTYNFFEQGIIGVSWHEPDLIWQYNASYAEEGKKKEVISYFDGSLRSRQSVTLNNADNVSVVAEPVYDAMGRAAMSILPAPSTENKLQYYRLFNVNTSDRPVSYKDIPNTSCSIVASPLKPSSGVEQYYSANNPFANDPAKPWNKAIPQSEGFPFAVTQYTPDNTGRIRAQGGVGPDFQLGSGHETKYYYGKPSQYELDRLFGAEAGDHTHYLKNMVQDANGQVSVSYQNSEGKTIATALAGLPPNNLEALSGSSEPTTTIRDVMLTPSSFQVNSARSSLEATAAFLVSSTGEYKFTYRFLPEQYNESYTGGMLCYTCSYDLLVTIKDECGTELGRVQQDNITPYNINCSSPAEQSGLMNIMINKIGEYTAYFELLVNKQTLDAYTDHYLVTNTDIKKLNYFLLQQLVEENLSECYNDCASCKDLPAEVGEFISKVRAYFTKENLPFGLQEEAYATDLYNSIKANCENIGSQCLVSPCDEILEVIKADVTPGGQYAEVDNDYNLIDPEINVLVNYTAVQYFDENGQPALVENENGVMVAPSALPLKEFIEKFEDSWAASLAPYHPEYCYYTWCTMNPESQLYNQELEELNDATLALENGRYVRGNPLTLLENDPFFSTGFGTLYANEMEKDLNEYSNRVLKLTNQTTKDILETIDFLLYCGPQDPPVNWDDCDKALDDPCRSDYKEWILFKEWYLDQKLKYYYLAMKEHLPECNNCFIPSSGNADPVNWAGCIPPPATGFTIDVVDGSSADGIKRIRIKYKDGNEFVQWPLTLQVFMQAGPGGTSLIQPLVFAPGAGIQEMMVQDEFTIFQVQAVSCTEMTGAKMTNTLNNANKQNKPGKVLAVGGDCSADPGYFEISWEQLPTGGHNVTTCYNGPPIPAGMQVVATVNVEGPCGITSYDVAFCGEEPACDIRFLFGDRNPCDEVYSAWIDPSECRESDCQWLCPENPEENFTIDQFYDDETGDWFLTICYTGIAIPPGKSIVVNTIISTCQGDIPYQVKFCSGINCVTRIMSKEEACGGEFYAYILDFYCEDAPCSGSGPCPGEEEFSAETFESSCPERPGFNAIGIRITHNAGPLVVTPPVFRVKVKLEITTVDAVTGKIRTFIKYVWFQNGDSQKEICFFHLGNQSITGIKVLGTTCSGACPGGDCCDDPRYSQYDGKVRRFQEYVEPDFDAINNLVSSGTINFSAYPLIACKSECELLADSWINDLKDCTGDPVVLERIRRQLIEICNQSCDAQNGNPVIHPYSDLNPLPSFETIIANEFGGITPECAYELISDPYPWGKVPMVERTFATETNLKICDRFEQLRNEAAGEGYATDAAGMHEFFQAFYGPYYDLELEEIEDIITSCEQCEGIIRLPVELPAFMDGDYKECKTCYEYDQLYHDFEAKYPGINSSHPKFEVLFKNFVNHQTGFSHPYAVYYDFQVKCEANENDFRRFGRLCERPMQLEMDIDLVSECMEEKFYNALSSATVLYTAYIEEVKRVYRNNYTIRCLAAKPKLESEAKLYEYHYTLYYYDQSSNLVKTVPPKGVAYLSDAQITQLQQDRTQFIAPVHTLATIYQYNSFNQVVKQTSPDGGTSLFWYDRLGRLAVSQNEEQRNPVNGGAANRYSYTKYEPVLGRITEVGEKSGAQDIAGIDTRNDGALQTWLGTGTDAQITQTIYDKIDPIVVTNTAITQDQPFYTSRKRVVASIFKKIRYASLSQYDAATHYSYDINGNAKIIWQENERLKEADPATQGLKRLDYEFDLVSGKVNRVFYQKGKGDQFIYRYGYDAENRVTSAETSRDGLIWQTDATYRYYLHGPLARTELGNLKVQGVDYAYTLQGWMKYINGPVMNETADIGKDGDITDPANIFKKVSRDAMAYGISYYNGEYKPVQPGSPLAFVDNIPGTMGTGKELFNGNIRATTLQVAQLGTPKTYSYSYDQLNRIVKMRKHETTYTPPTGGGQPVFTVANPTDEYREDITYDPNGNILTYLRNGIAAKLAMDNLAYNYLPGKNQLDYVDEDNAIPDNQYSEDIDDGQVSGNYLYDKIGNLRKDFAEKLGNIEWTVYGKIRKITKTDANNTTIEYEYDATGNRIYKKVSAGPNVTYTYYIRDAQGNAMAIYTRSGTATIQWAEQHLYGSSRLGIGNLGISIPATAPVPAPGGTLEDGFYYGKSVYEFSNHLGSVLVTISDKKIGVDNNSDGNVDYYKADVITANDMYPGGMIMPGRKWDNGSGYQYGFNGKRKDNEIYGEGNAYDFDARVYDPRLVKWLSVDPLQKKLPSLTPYNYCYNNPIRFFDPDGRLGIRVEAKYNEQTGKYTILKITIDDDLRAVAPIPGVGNIGMDYHDYIDVTVYDEKGNIDYTRSTSQTSFRTNNIIMGKWWAKSKVNDGVFEDYGGIMWTSEDQTSGSEETRKGRPSYMNNIDGLLAMVNGGNKLAGHEFEKKGLLELLDKFAELIQQTSDSAPADNIDKDDPKQASLFKQLEAILAKYSNTPTTPSENTSKDEQKKATQVYSGYKKGTILHTRLGNVRVDSDSTGTCCQDDKKATDTVPSMKKTTNL